jgi:glycosyltransferase involved in cell wall biosynthesis
MNIVSPPHALLAHARPLRFASRERQLLLDLSRLISRAPLHPTPTGVDRVEMAYAQELLRRSPSRLAFTAQSLAWRGRLPAEAARRFLSRTARRWDGAEPLAGDAGGGLEALWAAFGLTPSPWRGEVATGSVLLQLSPSGLERTAQIRRFLRRERARFVPFVHDLIPLDYPEYARPRGAAKCRRKLATVTALADGVLVNSHATARALAPYLAAAGRRVPVHVAPLAPSLPKPPRPAQAPAGAPYFVMLGTIEPRKNHLLMLNIWRRLAQELGPQRLPRLVLIGRRGWENENILDLLDRNEILRGVVEERGRLPDREASALIGAARALLMPSFAEGYGLPVAEALSLGTPVIASDLPALREAGGLAAEYLDPLDGAAWRAAILDYAEPDSERRGRQLARMTGWRPSTWTAHVAGVMDFLDEIAP